MEVTGGRARHRRAGSGGRFRSEPVFSTTGFRSVESGILTRLRSRSEFWRAPTVPLTLNYECRLKPRKGKRTEKPVEAGRNAPVTVLLFRRRPTGAFPKRAEPPSRHYHLAVSRPSDSVPTSENGGREKTRPYRELRRIDSLVTVALSE